MLVAAAFVPSAPLLLRALGGGPNDLTSACQKAICVLEGAERIVVLGAAQQAGWMHGTIDATPYGAPGSPADLPLPLAHAVGATLLDDRPHDYLGVGGPLPAMANRCGLLVVGDGSARRTEKAPGHLDPRAEAFDASVEQALASGDPAALMALDADLAHELLAGGASAWTAAAAAAQTEIRPGGTAPGGWRGELHYAAAPFGVGYFVASWTPYRA